MKTQNIFWIIFIIIATISFIGWMCTIAIYNNPPCNQTIGNTDYMTTKNYNDCVNRLNIYFGVMTGLTVLSLIFLIIALIYSYNK